MQKIPAITYLRASLPLVSHHPLHSIPVHHRSRPRRSFQVRRTWKLPKSWLRAKWSRPLFCLFLISRPRAMEFSGSFFFFFCACACVRVCGWGVVIITYNLSKIVWLPSGVGGAPAIKGDLFAFSISAKGISEKRFAAASSSSSSPVGLSTRNCVCSRRGLCSCSIYRGGALRASDSWIRQRVPSWSTVLVALPSFLSDSWWLLSRSHWAGGICAFSW